MNPKQKAKQLIKKFTSSTMRLVADYEWVEDIDSTKQCALIAVYEILDAIDWHEFETPNKQLEYWSEVQQELFNY
jgi:hypothetical protein